MLLNMQFYEIIRFSCLITGLLDSLHYALFLGSFNFLLNYCIPNYNHYAAYNVLWFSTLLRIIYIGLYVE